MRRGYRSRSGIILDLLRSIKGSPDGGSTVLLFEANLSHERLVFFLGQLAERGMIEASTEEPRRYRLTAAGQQLLSELDRVDRFMTNFGMRL